MTTYLRDVSVLIAAAVIEHESHERVARWLRTVDRIALCPITQGALVRFLLRVGESHATATEVLRRPHERRDTEFWPDTVSYRDTDLSGLIGHRQVTDAYLVALAAAGNAALATLDEGLRLLRPGATLMVPA